MTRDRFDSRAPDVHGSLEQARRNHALRSEESDCSTLFQIELLLVAETLKPGWQHSQVSLELGGGEKTRVASNPICPSARDRSIRVRCEQNPAREAMSCRTTMEQKLAGS